MDMPSTAWLSDLEMEEPCGNMRQQTCHYYSDQSPDSFSSESFKNHANVFSVNQSVQLASVNGDLNKKQDYKPPTNNGSLSSTFTISFGNPTSPPDIKPYDQLYGGTKLINYPDIVTPKEETSLDEFLGSIEFPTRVQTTRRNHIQSKEHVLAERKRREKLAQRFMSLSALLPGVKRMDKATVLDDASKYIVQLQNQLKELKETSVKGKEILHESVVSTRRSKFCVNHGDMHASSSEESKDLARDCTCDPEIKAKISGRNILLRIYCGENSSMLLKTLMEMERLCITDICCSVLPFSDTANLITITAQMSREMVITTNYLVKCLQSALSNFT